MADAADYTDPYLHTYRPVPRAGTGVCRVCRSGPNTGFDICYSCHTTTRQVTRPTLQVVPISLYKVPGQLWHVLRHYKDGPPQTSRLLATQVAAIIARFIEHHHQCLDSLGGSFTLTTTVPSTRPTARSGEHPLVNVVRRVRRLNPHYAPTLVRGPGLVGHNLASDDVFTPVRRVDDHRVLLIDDTFTTGARLQSAASTLFAAGATNVTALVVGRVIDSDWNDNCRHIWKRVTSAPFSFDRCCLCST